MAVIKSFEKTIKSSIQQQSINSIKIRSANIEDAEQILFVAKSVIDEEVFQLMESSEFNLTLDKEEKWIQSFLDNPFSIILVAEVDCKLVGILDFSTGHRKRIAHTGDISISILKDFRNLGIGSILLQTLFEWARSTNQIEKINLQVHATNSDAIRVYKKNGFVIEGIRKKELKYSEGKYVDSVLMAIFLSSNEKKFKEPFPTIKTDRLKLRQFKLSDAKDVQRLAGNPKVAEATSNLPHPYLDGLAEDWISKHQDWFENGISVDFAIELDRTGELIGNISLMINKLNQKAEIGYRIGEDYWNNGYCTEAMKPVLHYAFEVKNLNKITCRHSSANPSSGRVIIKSGLVQEGHLKQDLYKNGIFYDTLVYGLLQSEWALIKNRIVD